MHRVIFLFFFLVSVLCFRRCKFMHQINKEIQLFYIIKCKKTLIQMFRSQSLQHSRKKQPLKNLNTLLEQYQMQASKYPKSSRLQYKNEIRPKTMSMERVTIYDTNVPIFKPLKLGYDGNNSHTRTMSQNMRAGHFNQNQIAKSCQQLRKQKMVHMLSTQNMRKQLIHSKKLSAIQYRSQQMTKKQMKQIKQKNNQNRRQEHDLRLQMFNNMSSSNKQIDYMAEYKNSSQNSSNLLEKYKKLGKQRLNKDELMSRQLQFSQKDSPKKQYLKKGTSINKSILTSLIKLKLSRNNGEVISTQRLSQKYIDNDQIYKMIKVYKGLQPALSKQKVKQDTQHGEKDLNFIEGWHNQTQDFDIQAAHTPPHAQSVQI